MPTVKTRRRPAQDLRATIDRLPLDVREAVLEGIKSQRIIAGAHVDGSGGVCPMVAADVRWLSVNKSSVKVAQEAARAWDRYAEASGRWHPASKRQLLALRSMLEASILAETARSELPLSEVIAEHKRAIARGDMAPEPAFASFALPLEAEAAPATPAPRRRAERDLPTPSVDIRALRAQYDASNASAGERPRRDTEETKAPVTPRRRRDTGELDRTSELSERAGWSWLRPFRSYDEYEDALVRALAELDRHEAELDEVAAR
jgi:hypothetical protein